MLTSQTVYDVFGQASINLDVAGNYSYKTYDQLGRLVSEVDANHNATRHVYSSLVGQSDSLTRLDASATFTDSTSVSADAINAAVTAVLASGTPRSVSTTYDLLGRQSTTSDKYSKLDLSGAAYSFDASTAQGGNWVGSTSYTYDVWGGLVASDILLDRVANTANRHAITRYGYNLQGALIRQVDAQGYVSDHQTNAFGEDTRVTQYASTINPDGDLWAIPASALADQSPTSTSATGHDRISTTTYDRRGMKLSDGLSSLQSGQRLGVNQLGLVVGQLRTVYAYDGVGNITNTSQVFEVSGQASVLGVGRGQCL